ncbi:DNA polymerase III subunit delta' [Mycoplasmopsis californica]|uniref:DNA polymerase III subunit delta n=1 Tax=Mycoplasmopsis equigenitalium TaxID=114883 RepID=A0ABY5J151_9BACT|nr:hypothetical protein [Mycoplasmopsis equigenitalium]UUD36949.1 hypothetical protein NPA09_03555 [Mycoplasmopsis equigenitalium]VEU69756.1 DNA polymerase III subunit delta' [Mycoplasmopsis californica]
MDIFKVMDAYVKNKQLTHCYIFHASQNTDIEQYMLYFFNKINKSNFKKLDYEQSYDNVQLVNFDYAQKTDAKITGKEAMVRAFSQLENKISGGRKKFLMIKNLDEMHVNAIGYILKLIEEPSPNSIIMISTRNLSNLPKTIISRAALLKVPITFSEQELKQIKKEITSKEFKEILMNIFYSYKHISEFIKFFSLQDITNVLSVLVESTTNKYKLAAYIIEKMDMKNYYYLCSLLIFLFQEARLQKTQYAQKNIEQFEVIANSKIAVEKVVEYIYKFIKTARSKYNFFLFKQILIIDIMRSYV